VSNPLPDVYLVRHGETQWTLSGQHTGLTDLPLTAGGEEQARRLRGRLKGATFAKVLTSPLQRARRTCELCGYGSAAETDRDLVEWNYGDYEGWTRTQILAERPDWLIFRHGCRNGESPQDVAARAFDLPREFYDEGIRRYGFHGLSYEYVASVLPERTPEIANGRVTVAHLGNGASLCALNGCKSIARWCF
jgi:hypothetical protein